MRVQIYSAQIERQIYQWEVEKLWELTRDFPVQELVISDFDAELDKDHWFDIYDKPSVNNVLLHYKKIMESDLSYPIIVLRGGEVVDGMHRIAKAKLLGSLTVKAKFLEVMPKADRIVPMPSVGLFSRVKLMSEAKTYEVHHARSLSF